MVPLLAGKTTDTIAVTKALRVLGEGYRTSIICFIFERDIADIKKLYVLLLPVYRQK